MLLVTRGGRWRRVRGGLQELAAPSGITPLNFKAASRQVPWPCDGIKKIRVATLPGSVHGTHSNAVTQYYTFRPVTRIWGRARRSPSGNDSSKILAIASGPFLHEQHFAE